VRSAAALYCSFALLVLIVVQVRVRVTESIAEERYSAESGPSGDMCVRGVFVFLLARNKWGEIGWIG
jgi:hypothetical protein